MEAVLNRNSDLEPRTKSQDDLALHDLKVKEINPNQNSYSDASLDDLSTIASKTGSIEPSLELDDPEEVLKQRVTLYTTYQSPLDTMHTTMVAPSDSGTLFSTMKVVSSDIERVKDDLSYYQYKLYQKFSVKTSDLVRLETLGKGAFGEVTRVFNKADREFYALKEIRRQSFKKPIYFESAVWTEIQNLLKVMEAKDPLLLKTASIDFDEDEETSYLLMEFGGGTLEDYAECMRHYGMSWTESELEFVLSQLISQVLKLKKIDMYHRDIKPANVIIATQDDVFKLSDLGCACIIKEGVHKLDIAGTPHFMSPEIIQAIMKREQVVQHDPFLSDLYSIAITILALLEPDFKRNDIGRIMENIVKSKYPVLYPILKDLLGPPAKRNDGLRAASALRPSIKTYREFNMENLGPKYRLYLYLKVISKNKDIDTSFYFDMFILDDALQVIRKKIYLLTRDKKPEDQNLEEVMWRLRLVRCYYMQMNYDEALKELLVIMQRKELKSFETANVMTQAKALLWLGMVKVKLGRMEEAIDHIMHCLGIRVAEYGEVHEDVCEIFWQLGDTKIHQDNLCGAVKAFQKCVEIGEKLDPKQRQFMAKALNNLGVMSELKGDYKKALELYERAKETAIAAHGEHHPAVADQDLGIAYVNIVLGKSQDALSLYDKALELKVRWYGESNPEVADAYSKIAKGYDRLGEYSKVLELLSKSVTIWKKVNGEESQELADVYQLIGDILCKKGQYKQSLEYANKVISIKEKHLGKNHPWLAGIYVWHANLCDILRLPKDKEKSVEQFLAIDYDKLELNVDSIRVGFNGARLLAEEGKVDKAWEYVQKANVMCTNLAIAKNSKTYANYCEAIGRLKMAEGKHQEALEKIKEALNIRFMIICKDHDIGAGLFSVMGDLHEALKQNEEALEWRRRCRNIIEKYLSKGSLLLVKALVDLSRVLVKLGKKEEAKETLEETKNLIDTVNVARCHPLVHSQIDLTCELEGKPSPFVNDNHGEKH